MYKYNRPNRTKLIVNTSYVGERLEEKIQRILNNKEPISDGAPLIYSERKDGVQPAYNIRTDRWEIAIDAMDKVDKIYTAKREDRMKTMGEIAKENSAKEDAGGKSTQGTGDNLPT